MLAHLNLHDSAAPLPEAGRTIIENVSRRSFLKGTAGFVVALQILPAGAAKAYEAYPHGG